jgi:hypothetical protein
MQTHDIQLRAATKEALDLICQALEAQYSTRVQLYRFRTPDGEWRASGTIAVIGARRASHPLNKPGHRRIIIA